MATFFEVPVVPRPTTETLTNAQARRFLATGQLPDRDTPAVAAVPSKGEVKAEKELQRLCELELHGRGIVYLHLSPKAREKSGWPDLCFPLPESGRFTAVELKSKRGRLSQEQVDVLENMKDCGAAVYVIRDMVDFIDVLNGEYVMQWQPGPKGTQ